MSTLEEFNRELAVIAETMPQESVTNLQREIGLEGLHLIVDKTPVDTGRATGNWQTTIGTAPEGEKFSADPKGDGAAVLVHLPPFDVVFISNNVPYIRVLEEGGFIPPDPGESKDPRKGRKGRVLVRGGFSVQAARGMVAVSVEELRTIFA